MMRLKKKYDPYKKKCVFPVYAIFEWEPPIRIRVGESDTW